MGVWGYMAKSIYEQKLEDWKRPERYGKSLKCQCQKSQNISYRHLCCRTYIWLCSDYINPDESMSAWAGWVGFYYRRQQRWQCVDQHRPRASRNTHTHTLITLPLKLSWDCCCVSPFHWQIFVPFAIARVHDRHPWGGDPIWVPV